MIKSFSLAFPLTQMIYEHQQIPHKSKVIRFCQQQLIDRIITLSLPLFASFDVLFHLTASLAEGACAGYKAFIYLEVFSFDKTMRHLKIAWLFTKVIFTGPSYVINPYTIDTIFKNSLTRFIRALLLSGCPETFVDPTNTGGTEIRQVLDVMCSTMTQLPKATQETMAETLKLVKEAYQFEATIRPNDWFLSLSCEHGFRKVEETFRGLKAIEGSFFTKLLKRELYARLYIFMITLTGLLAIPFSLIVSTSLLLKEIIAALLPHQDTYIHSLLWRIKLDLIAVLRMYISFPFALVGGIIDPFKIQSLCFSPLYKGDKKVKDEAIKLLFKKIKDSKTKESVLVPLFTYTDDPHKGLTHAYCILVTKQNNDYRISTLNRGWGMEMHRPDELNQLNGDVSYDNVPFKKIKKHLTLLIDLKEFKAADEIYNGLLDEKTKGYNPFLRILYRLPALWKSEEGSTVTEFQSNHSRSCQKISNCGVASLMAALSFHSSMQTGDTSNKTSYKKFIYSYKKLIYKKYNYLLDFDLQPKKSDELLSLSAERQLAKMKRKLYSINSKTAA